MGKGIKRPRRGRSNSAERNSKRSKSRKNNDEMLNSDTEKTRSRKSGKLAKVSNKEHLQHNVNGNSMIQSIPTSSNRSRDTQLSRELFKETIANHTGLKTLGAVRPSYNKFNLVKDRIIPSEMLFVLKEKTTTLAEQLDEIDAEFDNGNGVNVMAPDGILMHVDLQHEHEFSDNENLDYEEDDTIECIYPVPSEDDADTVIGEDNLNSSLDSSMIISFKKCEDQNKSSKKDNPIPDPRETNDKRKEDMTPDQLMNANPALKELMGKLMDKGKDEQIRKEEGARTTDSRIVHSVVREAGENNDKTQPRFKCHVKSPSDTTIYAPALKLTPTQVALKQRNDVPTQSNVANNNIPEQQGVVGNNQFENESNSNIDLEKRISDFTRQIRVDPQQVSANDAGKAIPLIAAANCGHSNVNSVDQMQRGEAPEVILSNFIAEPQPGTSLNQRGQPGPLEQIEAADKYANNVVIQAECFRADTEIPRGMKTINLPKKILPQPNVNQQLSCGGISDDKFFHLTCHVDPNMKAKIQKGEFVDLEKLLVRDCFKQQNNSGQRMELVNRGGETFIMPVDSGAKLTNVRRWEQAFHIYAAIYSQANPHRSSEIWQYVFVINSAASTYTWENVANYDYTFRQLMACDPGHSWANIYLQMWNLTMRDVIPRNFQPQDQYRKDGKKKGG